MTRRKQVPLVKNSEMGETVDTEERVDNRCYDGEPDAPGLGYPWASVGCNSLPRSLPLHAPTHEERFLAEAKVAALAPTTPATTAKDRQGLSVVTRE
jgi:hypothetical protein